MRTLRNTSNERRRKDLRPRAYQVSEPDKKIEDPMIYNSNDEFSRYFSYLIENNKKGVDDELPFFTSFPNIAGNYNLISLAERKVQEVLSAYDGGTIELNDDDPHYDIVTIIPYRGRYLHLKETVKSLISSANLVDKKIGFYVIENSSIKTAPSDILNFDNVKYRHINSKGKVFNKCICHNIGVSISKSDFVHFHDCDLIVPTNFYELLIKEHENSNAVQCFTNRRVNYIDEKSSLEIFRGQRIDSIISNPRNFKVGTPGAPGGSISVSRDLFLKCGGFDSHFFWSYSIEDKFFWSKIEKYERVKGMNNPPIELFHLWHPPGWGKNPYERFEQRIYHSFESENNWEDYIRKSIDLYNKTINHIVKR